MSRTLCMWFTMASSTSGKPLHGVPVSFAQVLRLDVHEACMATYNTVVEEDILHTTLSGKRSDDIKLRACAGGLIASCEGGGLNCISTWSAEKT